MIDTKLYISQLEALNMEFEVLLKNNSELVEEYSRLRNDYFTIKDIIKFDPVLKKL